jgi:hypothetical protein
MPAPSRAGGDCAEQDYFLADGTGYLNDTWSFDGTSWTQITSSIQSGRLKGAAAALAANPIEMQQQIKIMDACEKYRI